MDYYTIKINGSYINYYSEEINYFLTDDETNSGNLLLFSEKEKDLTIEMLEEDKLPNQIIQIEKVTINI
jgi:hypothetical protein